MSRIMLLLIGLALTAGMLVTPVLAEAGRSRPKDSDRPGEDRIKREKADGDLAAGEKRRSGPDSRMMKSFRMSGEVEELTATLIKVNGEIATITDSTRMPDDLAVGETVAVQGVINQEGERFARAIHRDDDEEHRQPSFQLENGRFQVRGEVESIATGPGYVAIVIGGRTFRIAPLEVETYVQHGVPATGQFVAIKGIEKSDGNLLATSLKIKN